MESENTQDSRVVLKVLSVLFFLSLVQDFCLAARASRLWAAAGGVTGAAGVTGPAGNWFPPELLVLCSELGTAECCFVMLFIGGLSFPEEKKTFAFSANRDPEKKYLLSFVSNFPLFLIKV